MTLLYFLHEPREAGFPELQALAGDLRAAGVSFDVRNGTGHYYMHSLVAQSYEAHAWLADHALSGLPAFDAVHFAGGGGWATTPDSPTGRPRRGRRAGRRSWARLESLCCCSGSGRAVVRRRSPWTRWRSTSSSVRARGSWTTC